MEDLIYLKKTVSKDGKFISDDFIKYHKLTDTIIQDEDDIINTHMEVVKQDAKLLTEEGRLISLIKGIGTDEDKIEIDEYIQRLDNVLDQKMNIYSGLQDKIDIYKGHLKEEDKMRKITRNGINIKNIRIYINKWNQNNLSLLATNGAYGIQVEKKKTITYHMNQE